MIYQAFIPPQAGNLADTVTINTNLNGNFKVKLLDCHFLHQLVNDLPVDEEIALLQSNIFANIPSGRVLVPTSNHNFKELEFISNIQNQITFSLLDAVTFVNLALNVYGCLITLDINPII